MERRTPCAEAVPSSHNHRQLWFSRRMRCYYLPWIHSWTSPDRFVCYGEDVRPYLVIPADSLGLYFYSGSLPGDGKLPAGAVKVEDPDFVEAIRIRYNALHETLDMAHLLGIEYAHYVTLGKDERPELWTRSWGFPEEIIRNRYKKLQEVIAEREAPCPLCTSRATTVLGSVV